MLRTVRNIAIAVFVLLILIVGGAVLYVMLSGQETDKKVQQQAQVPDNTPPKPTKPNPNNPVGASVASLITPVKAGDNTSMTVHTTPTAKCTIGVKYGNVVGKDSGLSTKTADNYGSVTWSWTVTSDAPAGTWPVKVTCKYLKHTGFVQGDLKVTK